VTYILQANDSQLLIHIDSKSAVVGIQGPLRTNKFVQEVKVLSTEILSNQKDVSILWIPSHQGVPGSERTNKMAEEAAALPTYGAHVQTLHWT
jgi:ribonuclease HI